MVEKLIYSPRVFSYNWPHGDERHGKVGREIPYECYLRAVAERKPGDKLCAFASAPGTGRVVYEITRIDETGVYGFEVENTVRELQAWEVV